MQIQPTVYGKYKDSPTLYYAVSLDKQTNVKIQFMSRTNCPLPHPQCPPPGSVQVRGQKSVAVSLTANNSIPLQRYWQLSTRDSLSLAPGLRAERSSCPESLGVTNLHVAQLKTQDQLPL